MSEEPTTATAPPQNLAAGIVKALRPRQWVKNLLVFAAPLAALVVVILALAVVPQFLLKRSEPAVTGAVAAVAPDKASPSKLKGVQEVAPPAEEQP